MKSLIAITLCAYAQGAPLPVPDVTKMSIEALIGQMSQVTIQALGENDNGTFTLNETKLELAFSTYQIGSVLNSPFSDIYSLSNASSPRPADWVQFVTQLQQTATTTGSKIPIVYGLDSIHGASYVYGATLFPQPINGASSFNRDLVERQAHVTAKDTRAVGVGWVFAPILGIALQPQWPRVWETLGEDPHLTSQIGAAFVRGMQGFPADLKNTTRAAACMKHFFGYSDPRSGHDRSPAWIPERFLHMYFMPPFEATIAAGVATAMESYGDVNGIPLISSKLYLDDILRQEMNFTGMLVSDWAEIRNLHAWHHVAESDEEAVRLALLASTSLDMSMIAVDFSFPIIAKALYDAGKIPRSRFEAGARRVIKLKQDLGLFNEPFQFGDVSKIGAPEDIASSLALAQESMILLQNDGILPLSTVNPLRILVTGPTSDSLRRQNGGWTLHWQGAEDFEFVRGSTVRTALEAFAAQNPTVSVTFEPGCDIVNNCDPAMLNASVEAAKMADLVIVGIGEDAYCEKPGDIDDLSLSTGQQMLVRSLAEVGTPMVMLMLEGRPRILHGLADLTNATIMGWLPGPEGGQAFVDLLFGKMSFSAKLPMTYPRNSNAILGPYWHSYSLDTSNPQWRFGHGMSYTTFNYSAMSLSRAELTGLDQELVVTVKLTNTGNMRAKEVVFVYLSDLYRIIAPEVGMLKGFQKLDVDVGQEIVVSFTLIPRRDMWFMTVEGSTRTWEDGDFTIEIGGSPLGSDDNLRMNARLTTGNYPAQPITYPTCSSETPTTQPGGVVSAGVLVLLLFLSALLGAGITLFVLYKRGGMRTDRYEAIKDP